MRVPDHGKLAPWRFVVIEPQARAALAALLERAYRTERPEPGRLELEAIEQFAHQAPTLVVALSAPDTTSHIPVWEQELSAGAAVMNLIAASHAEGFVAGWLTGWAAYSPIVNEALGFDGARIAGFVFIGTAGRAPEERPRPDFDTKVSWWRG
jgi:nitroreductase